MRKEVEREKEKDSSDAVFSDFEEGAKEQEVKTEELPIKAAKQIFSERNQSLEPKNIEKKKEVKTIEDAIKKAIDEEKKIIVIDT